MMDKKHRGGRPRTRKRNVKANSPDGMYKSQNKKTNK